jgi:pyruvate dehydrogenase E2 component (dihydrolipoamide acetyltransferase)
MYGISSFTPIVNLPQSAILGVNAAEEVLYLQDGEVRSRKVMTLSLTIDHRVIDGAQGAIFLDSLAKLIENPVKILL